MLAQTSLLAYRAIKELGTRQQQVHDAVETLGSASNEELSDYLGWPIQSVTGRVNELSRYGYLGVEGITKTKSGRSAKLWSLRDPADKRLKELDCFA